MKTLSIFLLGIYFICVILYTLFVKYVIFHKNSHEMSTALIMKDALIDTFYAFLIYGAIGGIIFVSRFF